MGWTKVPIILRFSGAYYLVGPDIRMIESTRTIVTIGLAGVV
jgi:hypothetical protein